VGKCYLLMILSPQKMYLCADADKFAKNTGLINLKYEAILVFRSVLIAFMADTQLGEMKCEENSL
jgi:hypothetical protein